MFKNVFVPYKGYWSTPFCRWQGSFQNEISVELAAACAKKFFQLRGYTPDMFDGLVLGATIPQRWWFYDAPQLGTLIGNADLSGPRISQACATSTVSVNYAAGCVETGCHANMLVVGADRMSNGPNLLWPNPSGPGGKPEYESWVMDGFGWDPTADTSPVGTAENVAREYGFSREQSDAMAINRYTKYEASLANDREFQKRYMMPVEINVSRKKTVLIEADEGILACTPDGMAKLKTKPDCIITSGAQTHPADGNAGIIITSKQRAEELSADRAVAIRIIAYSYARTKKAHMPLASTAAASAVMKKANITVSDLAAVKTHNPFTVNDLAMEQLLGIDDNIFNNYGSSLIFGHPQGPTTMRLLIELIEELVAKGGGYGLLSGCAAGDSGAALIVHVS